MQSQSFEEIDEVISRYTKLQIREEIAWWSNKYSDDEAICRIVDKLVEYV